MNNMKFKQSDRITVVSGDFEGCSGMVAEVLCRDIAPYGCYLNSYVDRGLLHFNEDSLQLEDRESVRQRGFWANVWFHLRGRN